MEYWEVKHMRKLWLPGSLSIPQKHLQLGTRLVWIYDDVWIMQLDLPTSSMVQFN